MAEPTVTVNIEASDLFNLGGAFIPQSASTSTELEHAKMKKANGDYEKFSDTFNEIETISVDYTHNGDTGMGAALPKCNEIKNAYLITNISVSSNTGEYPTITLEGHQHDVNPHTTTAAHQYAIPADVIAKLTGAIGAYDLVGIGTSDACVTSSTYSIGVNHIDDQCAEGDHFIGTSIEGLENIEGNYVGFISEPPSVGTWTLTNYGPDDSNDAHDVSKYSAERLVVRG